MRKETLSVGRRGEDVVCNWLTLRGHRILERNWRYSHQEIDIISINPEGLHIVEVKSRTYPALAPPEINVDRAKQKNLVKASGAYLASGKASAIGGKEMEVFFDVATVMFGPAEGDFEIEYYPQAFIPLYY